MPQEFTLSRPKALAALGTVGVASAGAGLGTSAYFSDVESFENNRLVADELDMHAAYSAHYSDWSPEEGTGVTVRMWDGPAGTTGGANDLESGETGLPLDDAWLIAVDDPETFLANTQYVADCDPGTDADDLAQPVIDLGDVKPGDFGEVTFDFALCDNPGYVWFVPTLRSASENGVTEPEADDPDEEETAPRPASEDGAGDDVELHEPTDLSLMDGLQWDGETVADGTTVRVGTGVAYEPFDVAPFGFEPVVTCVEAGTTVRWEWVDQTEVNPNIPNTVHHNVDIFQYGGDCTPIPESFVTSGHPVGYDSARGVDEPTPFTHTFDDPGIYPCYCEPHGPPESFPDPDPSTPENEALNDYHHPPGRPTEPPRDARGGDRHVLIGPLVPQTT